LSPLHPPALTHTSCAEAATLPGTPPPPGVPPKPLVSTRRRLCTSMRESVAPETPWYSGETPETVWWLLDEIAIPRLFAADLAGPNDVSRTLAWIKDHRMAKATLEMAVWDLFAKAAKVPLSKLLGGTRDRILCGVAIGIQPSIDALLDKIMQGQASFRARIAATR